MKKIAVLLGVMAMVLLAGCGKVRSANSLYKQAKNTHGKCTVVSKSESSDVTKVVLHDTLQDFDYTISSSMGSIVIDGTNFGSVPGTKDTFVECLKDKVVSNVKTQLDDACNMENMRYEAYTPDHSELLLIIYADNAKDGETAAVQCAKLLQEQNQKHRLDNMLIYAVGDTADKFYDNEHYGSVKLPDAVWRTPEAEKADYYTEMAHLQTDEKATFLRAEKGTFADTGADIRRVVMALGTEYPTEMNSPVTFYYFESSKGQTYYLCYFNYYEENSSQFAWYTNYKK